MDDLENKTHQMFVRVCGLGVAHSADIAPDSLAGQLFNALADVASELDGHAATQVSDFGVARESTANCAVAREALRDDLRAISRTAEAIAEDTPGFADKFRLPPVDNDQIVLHLARSFAANAAPLSAQFMSHELSPDFLADLNSDIAIFEAAISQQSSGVGAHAAAAALIDLAIADGLAIVRKLDAIVRNKYANDSATLAEWTRASHTERNPKRKRSESPPSTEPPA